MTTPEITGDEPYYPFFTYNKSGYGNSIVTGRSPEEQEYFNFNAGITIRQKFIADYAIKNRQHFGNSIDLFLEAEETFKSYLKIINGE